VRSFDAAASENCLCAGFAITSHVIAGRRPVADSDNTPDETMRID